MPEDTRKPVVEGAIHAERDPNPKHRGGVIFTMPDGSKVTVYDSGGQVFAFRTLNPGIKSSNAPGIIGTYVKTLKDKKGKLHDYNYPIFGSVKDAKGAALKEIEDINRRRGGDLSIEDVLGGDNAYNEGKGYYRQAIQPQISRLPGNPAAPDPSTKWSSLSPEQKDQIGEVILRQEGVYNSRGSTVIHSEKHSDANSPESLLPKSPIQTAASKSSDRLRLLYDAFVAQDADLNTLDHLAGFYPGSTLSAGQNNGAADQGTVDAFVRAATEFAERSANPGRTILGSAGLAAGMSTVDAGKNVVLSFLASPEGRAWIASSRGGTDQANQADAILGDLGRTRIGQQILSDPEMMALVVDASRQPGGSSALRALLRDDSPVPADDSAVVTYSELRRVILHQMSESGSGAAQRSEAVPVMSQPGFTGLLPANLGSPGLELLTGSAIGQADDRLAQVLGVGTGPQGIGWATIDAGDNNRAGRIRLFGDDGQDSSMTGTRNTVPERTPSSDTQTAPIDIREISRQVMRQIAEEGNRPPRGILVDPTVTPPLAGYAMFGP